MPYGCWNGRHHLIYIVRYLTHVDDDMKKSKPKFQVGDYITFGKFLPDYPMLYKVIDVVGRGDGSYIYKIHNDASSIPCIQWITESTVKKYHFFGVSIVDNAMQKPGLTKKINP